MLDFERESVGIVGVDGEFEYMEATQMGQHERAQRLLLAIVREKLEHTHFTRSLRSSCGCCDAC